MLERSGRDHSQRSMDEVDVGVKEEVDVSQDSDPDRVANKSRLTLVRRGGGGRGGGEVGDAGCMSINMAQVAITTLAGRACPRRSIRYHVTFDQCLPACAQMSKEGGHFRAQLSDVRALRLLGPIRSAPGAPRASRAYKLS